MDINRILTTIDNMGRPGTVIAHNVKHDGVIVALIHDTEVT